MKRHIPNALTCLNLIFGCFSIIAALEGRLADAAYFIGASAIADFFDGFVARLLKVGSEMGKQLDSLADVVSFGVAPGMILYMLSAQCTGQYACILLQAPPFIMVAFSAIRLAKFNIDTRQSDSFIGLPTPANAMFIASIPLIMQHSAAGVSLVFKNPYFLLLFPIVSAYLLVAELPLIALKFKSFSIKGNEYRYALIVLSVLSVITLGYLGVAVAIILYILLSILQQLQKNKTTAS